MVLRFNLLGEQRLTDQGAELGAGKTRALDLLAYLVLHPGMLVPRPVLAGTFWPESTDAQALTNLRRELHNLRELLGEAGTLDTANGALGWRPGPLLRSDVQVFAEEQAAARGAAEHGDARGFLRHAGAALACYRGDLMPGNYSDWVGPLREALQSACTGLCAEATAGWLAQGQAERALEPARRGVAVAPLAESGYRDLIGVQLALGEPAAAMHTFHSCAQMLEKELGVGPGAETLALVAELPGEHGPPVHPGRARDPIGRAGEMAQLRNAWDAAVAGHGSVALLSGGPGVGKTHLAEHLATWAAARGALVSRARCFDGGSLVPLAPVAAWLHNRELVPLLRDLPAHVQQQVRRLGPEMGGGRESFPAPGIDGARAMVDAWQRFGYFDALARGIGAAGRPTLLLLDDLQWCDSETAAWISFLFAGSYASRLLLVATMRTPDAPLRGSVGSMLDSLRKLEVLGSLRVEPFGETETAALAEALGAGKLGAGQAEMLRAATGGYPLFIVQAARILPGDGGRNPRELGAVLERRIASLGPEARDVASLVAANGRETGLPLLSAASELSGHDLVAAVDELWRLGILLPVGRGYCFAHQLLAEAAYRPLTPARRWLLHTRLARSLEALHAANLDSVAALLAEQHALASNPARALHYWMRAGAAATAVFANATALKSYRQALGIVGEMEKGPARDGAELEARRAMSPPLTVLFGYTCAELLENLERSLVLAERLRRPRVVAETLIGLFCGRHVQGRIEQSYAIGLRALDLGTGDGDLRAQAHFAVAGAALALGRPAEAVGHFAACYTSVTPGYSTVLGTRIEIHARAWASHAHWLAGDLAGARRLAAEALERSTAADHPYTRAVALALVAMQRQLAADREGLGKLVEELLELCRRYDIAYYRQWAEIMAGWSAGGAPGIQRIRTAIDALRSQDALVRMSYWHSLLADALARDGRPGAALAEIDTALESARIRQENWWVPHLVRQRELVVRTAGANRRTGERQANGGPPSVVGIIAPNPPGSTP